MLPTMHILFIYSMCCLWACRGWENYLQLCIGVFIDILIKGFKIPHPIFWKRRKDPHKFFNLYSNEYNTVDKIAFSQQLPGKVGSEHMCSSDFATFSWYQLTYSKTTALDRNHSQGKRTLVKSMRITEEFKSVQQISSFSFGKSTYQYPAVALLTVSTGRSYHLCLPIQRLSKQSRFTT